MCALIFFTVFHCNDKTEEHKLKHGFCFADVYLASSHHCITIQRRQRPPSYRFRPPPAFLLLQATAATAGIRHPPVVSVLVKQAHSNSHVSFLSFCPCFCPRLCRCYLVCCRNSGLCYFLLIGPDSHWLQSACCFFCRSVGIIIVLNIYFFNYYY